MGKSTATEPGDLSLFPRTQRVGKGELVPAGCPVTFACDAVTCTRLHGCVGLMIKVACILRDLNFYWPSQAELIVHREVT